MSRLREVSGPRVDATLLDHLLEGCQVIDREWRYVYVNKIAAKHGRTTKEKLLGRTMMECYPGIEHTPLFAALKRCMEQGISHRMENEFNFPDGSVGWFEIRIEQVPHGVFVLSIDITSRKEAEEKFVRAQRLESVGRLASGIAHDFNNELCIILNYAEFILERLKDDKEAYEDAQEILKAAQRASGLTRQLLAFSRRQVIQPQIVDINTVLVEMKSMLRRLLGEDIDLRMSLPDPIGSVKIDVGHLQQVVMNLAVNARDAMPRGGTLLIETANADLDEDFRASLYTIKAGSYVMLSIADTGRGMDKETQAKMFDPFFTTKGTGQGTGLGLATIQNIVQQAKGGIWANSTPGQGTTFKIFFPREASPSPSASTEVRASCPSKGQETILIVEDDEGVRNTVLRILTAAGYNVRVSASSLEALQLAQRSTERIDLLLTDVVMPDMNGGDLAQRMANDFPDMRVLFMSGYTDEAMAQYGILDPDMHLLTKPFNSVDLTSRIRRSLDEAPPNGRRNE